MRTLIPSITAVLALAASNASAQSANTWTFDLTVMCNHGCTIMIDLPAEARHPETAILGAGEFTSIAENNPLQYAYSIVSNGSGADTFVLTSEPGNPQFITINHVQAYMAGQDALMNYARRLAGTNTDS
jgi:hypothetical protein